MAELPMPSAPPARLYGLLAEYSSADELLAAAKEVRKAGYTYFDAYSPLPIAGLAEAMGVRGSSLPFLVLIGGICGGLIGYGLQYWTMVEAYPVNVGGRPLHSWPAFIPVTFELTVLGASLTAVLGMLALNKLPQPYHPLFNVPDFSLASQNRFFLCVEAVDHNYDQEQTEALLKRSGAINVTLAEY
jgi:hypothetical protein